MFSAAGSKYPFRLVGLFHRLVSGVPYSKERKLNRADAIVAPNGPNEPSIGYIGGVGEIMGA